MYCFIMFYNKNKAPHLYVFAVTKYIVHWLHICVLNTIRKGSIVALLASMG